MLADQQRYNTDFRQDDRALGHSHDAFGGELDGHVITRPLGQVAHMAYTPIDDDLAVLLDGGHKIPSGLNDFDQHRRAGIPDPSRPLPVASTIAWHVQ